MLIPPLPADLKEQRATAALPRQPASGWRPPGYRGHDHFWERAFSRRQLLRSAAGATALVATGAPRVAAARGRASSDNPRPIPFDLFGGQGPVVIHVDLPYFSYELSTITDFNGFVAAAELQGTGVGSNTATGATTAYTFDADMRIMDGVYVGEDGRPHRGLFGFV
jgi:hypothetical protein